MRNQRFQNRVTAGRFTLPAAILISVTCWILSAILLPDLEIRKDDYPLWDLFRDSCIPAWGTRLFSFILYSVIGYFLIGLNNAFAIIRMRASVQTAIYFLLVSVCPAMHILYAGDLVAVTFLIALYFLFRSYQQAKPASYLFHAFVFMGMGSLLFPQLMFFVPVFWIGAYSFQSLHPKSFFASLIGWSVPYWFLRLHLPVRTHGIILSAVSGTGEFPLHPIRLPALGIGDNRIYTPFIYSKFKPLLNCRL